MDPAPTQTSLAREPQDAWQVVLARLQEEVGRALYETWLRPLRPLSYQDGVFTLAAASSQAAEWVENRWKSRITHLLEGLYGEPLAVTLVVNGKAFFAPPPAPATPAGPPAEMTAASNGSPNRKSMLQRAYGSRRAAVVQPERGMFLTSYFFNRWLPLLGHSAATVVLAARSLCYWNPMTGELRNTVETDMSELARRAAVSLRTVKDVLANPLIQQYFLHYTVRRLMTPNGVRTAGILLQVRMDDPLTPEDQAAHNLPEEARWYTSDFDADREE